MSRTFLDAFGVAPAATGRAPGRVNLLGEHTDYNDGFVLPTPLPYFTTVAVGPCETPGFACGHSAAFGPAAPRPLAGPPRGDWLDYVVGCARVLQDNSGVRLDGLRVAVDSGIPVGAGLSSSAALEVATLRALSSWLGLGLADDDVASLGRQAERDYVGMPCGIMDQMVIAAGQPGSAMFLDTRTLAREHIPLPEAFAIAVVHSGVAHRLSSGDYRIRVRECREAARALGLPSLRDCQNVGDLAALPEPLKRRARHVVSENARVLRGRDALVAGDLDRFGALMTQSHGSQRDDYEVSVEEIDRLVETALRYGALGARLTGGGFGGSIVALLGGLPPLEWWTAVGGHHPAARLIHPAAPPTSSRF